MGHTYNTPLDPQLIVEGMERLLEHQREVARLVMEQGGASSRMKRAGEKAEACVRFAEGMKEKIRKAARATVAVPTQGRLDEKPEWEGRSAEEAAEEAADDERRFARFAKLPDSEVYGVRLPVGEVGEKGYAVPVKTRAGEVTEKIVVELVKEGTPRSGELWSIEGGEDRWGGGGKEKIDNSVPRFCRIDESEFGVTIPKDREVETGQEVEVTAKSGKVMKKTLDSFIEERSYGNVWSVE